MYEKNLDFERIRALHGDCSRTDFEAARRDLDRLYGELDRLLGDAEFFCGAYSLADIAVVPHMARQLGSSDSVSIPIATRD